jgi:AraC family transcriptional regulator
MHEHLDRKITLRELAQCVGLSEMYFAMHFREATGYSPYKYLLKLKVDLARLLLRTSDAPILDVALRCGFHNQQHFATVFKRLHGVSPSRYRGF